MKTSARHFAAVAVLFALAACGNKGPLVHPSAPAPEGTTPVPESPPSTDPTDALPQDAPMPPADTGTSAPPVPAAPVDDGDGDG